MIQVVMSDKVTPAALGRIISAMGTNSGNLDVWLKRLELLDVSDFDTLSPLIGGEDRVDTLRKLIQLCTVLANPSRILDKWLGKSIDDLISSIFQLRALAEYLIAAERGEMRPVMMVHTWCRHMLEEYAEGDEEDARRLVEWCTFQIACHDPDLASRLERCRIEAEQQSSGGSDNGSPVTITSEHTPGITRAEGNAPPLTGKCRTVAGR